MRKDISCVICGSIFQSNHGHAKYCSLGCSKEASHRAYRVLVPHAKEIASATVGAISELKVAVDLMQRNLAVFRALSAACPCDLAILKDRHLLRVEVKTLPYWPSSGRPSCNKNLDTSRFDVIAYVIRDAIHYFPNLETL